MTDVPKCGVCGRERALADPDHPMDAYDYSPLQIVTNQPLGWYSGDDGEMCPEDMARLIRG